MSGTSIIAKFSMVLKATTERTMFISLHSKSTGLTYYIIVQSNCSMLNYTVVHITQYTNGPRSEKTCLRWFANNKGADQPAHLRSLISVFVIRVFETIIPRLASIAILIFWLVFVAEKTGLKFKLSETPKTGFLVTRLISLSTLNF